MALGASTLRSRSFPSMTHLPPQPSRKTAPAPRYWLPNVRTIRLPAARVPIPHSNGLPGILKTLMATAAAVAPGVGLAAIGEGVGLAAIGALEGAWGGGGGAGA